MATPSFSWLDDFFGPAIVKLASVFFPKRPVLEFEEGAGATITVVDNPANKSTKVTIGASGGGGASPGGVNGDVQVKNGSAFAGVTPGAVGSVLRATGVGTSAFGPVDLADADARTGTLPIGNGGTGLTATGANGNVLTASGGVWVSTAPTAGAPTTAQYLTLATHASLSAERVFTPGTGLSAVDGGANGAYTLNCTFTPTSVDTLQGKTISVLANSLVSTGVGNMLRGVSGGVYDHLPKGTANQFLRMDGTATTFAWTTVTLLAPGGSSGDLQTNNGSGGLSGVSGSNGQFVGRVGGAWTATNNANFFAAFNSAAAGGCFRGANDNNAHKSRVVANTSDVTLVMLGTDDNIYFGQNQAAGERASGNRYSAASFHYIDVAGSFYQLMQSGLNAFVAGNASFFDSAGDFDGTVGGIYIKNATTPPGCGDFPAGGGILFSEASALKWIAGVSGTITTIAPGEPHCKKCGRDFAHEFFSGAFDEYLKVCVPCLISALETLGVPVDTFCERRLYS